MVDSFGCLMDVEVDFHLNLVKVFVLGLIDYYKLLQLQVVFVVEKLHLK